MTQFWPIQPIYPILADNVIPDAPIQIQVTWRTKGQALNWNFGVLYRGGVPNRNGPASRRILLVIGFVMIGAALNILH